MRFLVDQCVSRLVAHGLRQDGHEAAHVSEIGRSRDTDPSLFKLAAEQGAVVITADGDFGDLLAAANSAKPSVIFLREDAPALAADILSLLRANLGQLESVLRDGALVVVRAHRMRVRSLPLFPRG